MAKHTPNATISPAIQKLFVGIGAFFITLQVASQIFFMLESHLAVTAMHIFYIAIYTVLLPLALFVIAYLLHPRRAFTLAIVFESTLLAAGGFLLYSCLSYLGAFLPQSIQLLGDGQASWFASQAILFGTTALLYVIFLYVLRHTKHW